MADSTLTQLTQRKRPIANQALRIGFFIVLSLFLPITAWPVYADSEVEYRARLKQIRQQVSAIQKSIATKQAQRGKGISALKKSELEIAAIAQRMRDIDEQSQQAQDEFDQLDNHSQQLTTVLEVHQYSLNQQIKAAYQTGRTPHIQLFLNQQNPALISRMFSYYDYFNRARQIEIDKALALLEELQTVHQEKLRVTQRLKDTRSKLQKQHAAMQRASEKRRASISKLEKRLSKDSGRLSVLLKDQQDLAQLLEQLNQVFADLPPPPLERKPFKSMKGKLPWPAVGTLKAKYNDTKDGDSRRWKGMLIGAKIGSDVHAIYHGQIAFADWMNGFGLILIIDHGDNYMSIYANNQTLYKTQGEWVAPGELIATVGNSGGQHKGGIYFEIRRKGQPINPHRWVKKSIKSVSIQ